MYLMIRTSWSDVKMTISDCNPGSEIIDQRPDRQSERPIRGLPSASIAARGVNQSAGTHLWLIGIMVATLVTQSTSAWLAAKNGNDPRLPLILLR